MKLHRISRLAAMSVSFALLLAATAFVLAPTASAQQCCTGSVTTYCTAGTSVQGCVPQISGAGSPSISLPDGFDIVVSSVPGQRYGTVFYGFYSFITPWAPGSPSFKCIANPVQRMGNIPSGGTFGQCNGQLVADFNGWMTNNPTALGSPFAQGQTIRAQGWYRDPAAPGQTNLSDALTFTLCNGVGDTTPPVITTCASNVTLPADPSTCVALAPDLRDQVVATDNCSSVTITQVPPPGTPVGIGSGPIVLRARDAAGNAVTCAAVLTVADVTPPTITNCAANQNVLAGAGCTALVPSFTSSTMVSDCDAAIVMSQTPAVGSIAFLGQTTVTIRATDAAGNFTECTSALNVQPSVQCPTGTMQVLPGSSTERFTVAPNAGGLSQNLLITSVNWGRLVDMYAPLTAGSEPVLIFKDMLVDPNATTNTSYTLETEFFTGVDRLTIQTAFDAGANGQPSAAFRQIFDTLQANLQTILPKSLSPTELPPFSAVHRNAAISITFNDLLNPSTVSEANVKTRAGYPPNVPQRSRVFVAPGYGAILNGNYYGVRVIVDFSISEHEALASSAPVNMLGLPDATSALMPNVAVRIPTQVDPSSLQFDVLRNLSGSRVAFSGNGPSDPSTTTQDVLRAFRSGGKTGVTGDPNNGFLLDGNAPLLVGTQVVSVVGANNPNNLTREFDLIARFATLACAMKPRAGDIFEFPGQHIQVVTNYNGSIAGDGSVGPVRVRLLCDNCALTLPNVGLAGDYQTTFLGLQAGSAPDFGACFLQFSPTPGGLPNSGVSPLSTVTVKFSEPIDTTTVQTLDTFTLKYDNNKPSTNLLYSNVVGRMIPSQDLRSFTFQPVTPLRKQLPNGQADRYVLEILAGAGGVSDLAGNALAFGMPQTTFALSTTAAAVDSAGVSLKFNSNDEDGDTNPEIRGQILYDIARTLIRPRAVTRFSAVADPSQPVVGAMIPFPQPIQTPLSNMGSKMMGLWRYHDVGFGLRDESNHNVDVEGLWWTPFSATVQADNFSQFQLSLAHSKFLPDEELSTGLLPNWTTSGLVTNFDSNRMGNTGAPWEQSEPLTIMHAKANGYTILQSDLRLSATGNTIAPWPVNRNVAQGQYTYWTWRDTAKTQVAAPSGSGVDTQRLQQVVGKAATPNFYLANKVPTIGLPMLMEFRTYPDSKAAGQNGFRVALAINSSAMPFFRMYSTGGTNVNNPAQIKIVNPDAEPNATGAYPQNGLPAPGKDNVFYYGQGDFVVRVSRAHTRWFDSLANGTLYSEPVLEPSADLQPSGTQIVVAYRAANSFTLNTPPVGVLPYQNASNLDPYGDGYNAQQQLLIGGNANLAFTPVFFNTPPDTSNKGWKSSITALNNARYFQARITFVCNPVTGLRPELSSIGFAFRR